MLTRKIFLRKEATETKSDSLDSFQKSAYNGVNKVESEDNKENGRYNGYRIVIIRLMLYKVPNPIAQNSNEIMVYCDHNSENVINIFNLFIFIYF